eukprot:1149454-Pelagomonas_calceolata.AAC.1
MGFGRRTTVVVGGSFAGRRVASLLASKCVGATYGEERHKPCALAACCDPCLHEVVLVEEKGYTEFTPSILRTLVEPGHPVWEPIQATGIPVKVVTGRAAGASRKSSEQACVHERTLRPTLPPPTHEDKKPDVHRQTHTEMHLHAHTHTHARRHRLAQSFLLVDHA